MTDPQGWLDAAAVDAAVSALRPDYRAVLMAADGLRGGPSDEVSERILTTAEATARERLGGRKPEELSHVASWREAYRAFGAKPQRTRPSVESLLRRLDPGCRASTGSPTSTTPSPSPTCCRSAVRTAPPTPGRPD